MCVVCNCSKTSSTSGKRDSQHFRSHLISSALLLCLFAALHSRLSVSLCVSLLSGVVSVSFEDDEEGNLCVIAYPLQSDPAADLENKDPSADSNPNGETLKCGKTPASSLLVEDGRSRHSRKDKDKR